MPSAYRRSMTRVRLALLVLILMALGACSPTTPGQSDQVLARHGLEGMDARTAIDHLDRLAGSDRPTELIASVRPDTLVITHGAGESRLALPEEEFYLSFAPYIEHTHECFYHSLTTCQGELPKTPVHVRITDAAGTILVDEVRTSFDNGFVGTWLPRNITATLEVTHEGRSARQVIGTGPDDPTCLTTVRLR